MKDYRYEIENDKVRIVKYLGSEKAVTIPSHIEGLPVTSIAALAFSSDQLISVIIPNSVTRIGSWSFANNKLDSIVIPNSVTCIGNGAFAGNPPTCIVIPDSVTYIGELAFERSTSPKITIGDIEIPLDLKEEEWINYYSKIIEEKRVSECLSTMGTWELLD